MLSDPDIPSVSRRPTHPHHGQFPALQAPLRRRCRRSQNHSFSPHRPIWCLRWCPQTPLCGVLPTTRLGLHGEVCLTGCNPYSHLHLYSESKNSKIVSSVYASVIRCKVLLVYILMALSVASVCSGSYHHPSPWRSFQVPISFTTCMLFQKLWRIFPFHRFYDIPLALQPFFRLLFYSTKYPSDSPAE